MPSIEPKVGVINTFRNQKTEIQFAIGEFVDNSIDSYFKNKEELEKLIKKLEKLIFKIGGKENDNARKFNLDIANNTLKILRGSEVPRINHKNIPQGVSDISFLADCSSINQMHFDKKIQDKLEKGNKI